MANIPELIQEQLLLPPLQKVDPNNANELQEAISYTPAQVAVATVLTGIYQQSRTLEGASVFMQKSYGSDPMAAIFGDKASEVTEKVASYHPSSTNNSKELMDSIANKALAIIHEQIAQPLSPEKIQEFLSEQRHHILVYLPPELQLGNLLNDNTLDDGTNKMEGPVSSLMHAIEGAFSSGKEK